MTLKMMSAETLRLRALWYARGRSGCLVKIGTETSTQRELVEEGHLIQVIVHGATCPVAFKFTLSQSGKRMLDHAEENGWRVM